MHNVVIVLFFTLLGERMSTGQATATIVAEDSHLIVSLLCVSLPWQLLALECAQEGTDALLPHMLISQTNRTGEMHAPRSVLARVGHDISRRVFDVKISLGGLRKVASKLPDEHLGA